MTLLAILTGGTFVHYLFGGSFPIMGVFLTMVGLDLFTGYAKALKSHTFSTIICAAALDKLAPVVGIALPINVALIWTTLLILYEIGSILENAHAFGLKIAWLQKWLRVFERDVGEVPDKDDQENNVQ